jgi:hypothetical protein
LNRKNPCKDISPTKQDIEKSKLELRLAIEKEKTIRSLNECATKILMIEKKKDAKLTIINEQIIKNKENMQVKIELKEKIPETIQTINQNIIINIFIDRIKEDYVPLNNMCFSKIFEEASTYHLQFLSLMKIAD